MKILTNIEGHDSDGNTDGAVLAIITIDEDTARKYRERARIFGMHKMKETALLTMEYEAINCLYYKDPTEELEDDAYPEEFGNLVRNMGQWVRIPDDMDLSFLDEYDMGVGTSGDRMVQTKDQFYLKAYTDDCSYEISTSFLPNDIVNQIL